MNNEGVDGFGETYEKANNCEYKDEAARKQQGLKEKGI
jgi:hypothetical protein